MSRIPLLLISTLLLGLTPVGWAETAKPGVQPASSQDLKTASQAAILAAQQADRKAIDARSQWTTAAKALKASETLASAGRYAEAIQEAQQSQRLSDMAYEQGTGQSIKDFPDWLR